MAKFGNLIGTNQIADNAVGYNELSVALQSDITQITTNKNNIDTLLAKYDAGGVLRNQYVPHIALKGYAGEVESEVAMLALTVNLDGTPIAAGDTVDRTDLNKTFQFRGGALTDAANWKPILTGTEGVESLRNASGTVIGQKGIVTLANVAFSGAANDVSFAHASYTATDVSGALIEVMGAVGDVEADVTTLQGQMAGKLELSSYTPYLELTGTIDGTNKTFTSSVALAGAKVQVFVGGSLVKPADYSISGNDVVFAAASPDHEYQRPAVSILKAA